MKVIRVGLVGAGIIAKTHIECMRKVYGLDVQVKGVTDVVAEIGRKFAQTNDTKFYNSLEEMLPEVDVVDICTPPFSHAEIILNASKAKKHITCEKPLIGYAPKDNTDDFDGIKTSKELMINYIIKTLCEMKQVLNKNNTKLAYFENFVYTPHVQKEVEILKETNAQILRMIGEESHFGNPAKYSAFWKFSCGGSLISTGSHPIGGLLYLKRMEGIFRNGKPIRPKSVTARIHTLTKIESYENKGFIRNDYHDVEDYGWAHIVFEDGTVGDIISGATVLGGVNDHIDVFANNHRSRLNINLSNIMETYNAGDEGFNNFYVNDCISEKKGWLKMALDPNWMFGYQFEMQNALMSFANDQQPISDFDLAIDVTMTIYSAYLSAERLGTEVEIKHI